MSFEQLDYTSCNPKSAIVDFSDDVKQFLRERNGNSDQMKKVHGALKGYGSRIEEIERSVFRLEHEKSRTNHESLVTIESRLSSLEDRLSALERKIIQDMAKMERRMTESQKIVMGSVDVLLREIAKRKIGK